MHSQLHLSKLLIRIKNIRFIKKMHNKLYQEKRIESE